MTERRRHKVTRADDNVPLDGEVVLPAGLLSRFFGEEVTKAWAERDREASEDAPEASP